MIATRRLLPAVLVGVLAMVAFSSVVPGGGWVFDDHVLVERNADLQQRDVWVHSFGRDYYASSERIGNSGYYRPIPVLTHAVDVRVWQDTARGSHLTNLVLHTVASLLLPAALMALGIGALAAWSTAALFAVHPVHAESVAFVSGRVDVLATLFVLAAMACAARRGVVAALGVGVCTTLAFLSKEIALVTPLLLVLVWRTTAQRNRWAPAWPRDQIVAVVLSGLVVVGLRLWALDSLLPTTAAQARTSGAALLPLQSLLFSLASVYVPLRQILLEPDPQHLSAVRLVVGLVLAIVLWVGAWLRLPGRAALGRTLIAAIVSMLLVLNLLPQETRLSERFLYLASGFLLVPVGAWFAFAMQKGRGVHLVVIMLAVILVAWLLMLSSWRGGVWRTDVSVWRQATREEPHRAAFWDRLGLAMIERQSYSEAEVALRRSVALDPRNANAQHNMGVLLQSTRRPQEAVPYYQRALQLVPDNVQSYLNLGQCLLATRDYEAALQSFQTAARLKPDHVIAHRLAVRAALSARRPEVARRHLRAALQLQPDDPSLRALESKLQRLESAPAARGEPETGRK
jgi:tetratricopeptide (TPR) repeat protein